MGGFICWYGIGLLSKQHVAERCWTAVLWMSESVSEVSSHWFHHRILRTVGRKKKWETARLQHAQHVIKNKWLLLVGDGGKTQTKSESVARCQYTAYSRCLSLSRSYNHTESKKPCKPCSGEPSFRYTCVCLSQIHTSHYIFLLWWYIYIYITHYLLLALYICTGACRNRNWFAAATTCKV